MNKDSEETGEDSIEMNEDSTKDQHIHDSGENDTVSANPNIEFREKLNQIMMQRNTSRKKAQQRMKNTPLRKSMRQFGKMDQVSTRSQKNDLQHANKTAVDQNLHNKINQSDIDEVSVSKEINTPMLTYSTTNPHSSRSINVWKQLIMFLIASIGTKSQIFNSGGKIHMPNQNDKYTSLPEFKIDLRERELQSVNLEQKGLELQDIIDDENDSD